MLRTSLRFTLLAVLLFAGLPLAWNQTIPRIALGLPSAIEQLNPVTNFMADASLVNEYLYFSLLRPDKVSGKYLPLIATGEPITSADHRMFTYQIHEDARFNSGEHIQPADIIFSLKLIMNPWVNNAQTRIQYENIRDIKVVDARTVQFQLKQPSIEGKRITSDFAILSEAVFDPEHLLSSISLPQLSMPDKLLPAAKAALKTVAGRINTYGSTLEAFAESTSCGPYLVQEWKVGERIVLVSNKKFWGRKLGLGNPYFQQNVERIEVHTLRTDAQLRTGVGTGQIDIVNGTPPRNYFEFEASPKLKEKYSFHTPPGSAYEYIGLNMRGKVHGRTGIFDDVAVRRAFAHIVPVVELLEKVRFGLGERIAADCSAPNPDFRNKGLPAPEFDLAKAKAMLKAAGWEDHNGDGLLDKVLNGQETTFVVECILGQNRPYRVEIAARIQQVAMEMGIIVSFETLPWGAYISRLNRGEFDLYIGSWVSDPNEDSYQQVWHTKSWDGGSNFVGFGDAGTDALVDAYDQSFSVERRKELALEIQRLQAETQPYIFLWSESNGLIFNSSHCPESIGDHRPGFWIGSLK